MEILTPISMRLGPRVSGVLGPFNGHPTLANGLVSYWKLDEQSGTRFDSVTATGNDLTDNNTVTYVNSAMNSVVATFTSANNESLSNAYTWAAGTSYTFAAWIKITAAGIASAVHCEFIGGGAGGNFTFRAVSDTVLQLLTSGFGVNNQVNVASLSDKWHFVVGYYQDGVGSGVSFDGGAYQTAADVANGATTITCIGDRSTTPTSPMDGNMASVGMWTGVLPIGTVQTLYNSGVGKSFASLSAAEKTGLVSYWNLDEVSGQRNDSFGTNHLTDNNTVTSTTNSVPPPKNIAAYFTAANSESLSRTNASLVNWPQGNFHLAFWAYSSQDVPGAIGDLISKRSLGGQIEWRIETNGTAGVSDRVYLYASSDGTSEDVSVNLGVGSLPYRTWTFVELRRTGTTIGVAANGGAFTDGSLSAVFNGTAPFRMGCVNVTPALFYNGLLDSVGLWSRVLTTQERSDLYASGAGLFY